MSQAALTALIVVLEGTLVGQVPATKEGQPQPAAPAQAEPPAGRQRIEREIAATTNLDLETGDSRLIEMVNAIGRVSVADPEIADVKVITPRQIQITGHKVGSTNLSVWDKADQVVVMDVKVSRNLGRLRQQIKQLFPGEDIQVAAAGDLVLLSGQVTDVRLPQRAVEVASLHADRVANMIRVTGNQQVQLQVRFAEVSRSGLRELGTNFYHHDASKRTGALFSPETQPGQFFPREPANLPPFFPGTGVGAPFSPAIQAPSFSNAFNFIFSNQQGGFPFSFILSILQTNGLAKMLAEPTLVALSGQEAKFLAGGEVPIPLSSALGQVNVEFKKFGIQLVFVPTVLSDDTVHLKMQTEVSEPDPSVGVSVGGFNIPGFSSRQSETTVRLKDGQSFAIAGLLSDRTRSAIKKVPLLGDLPILGALFRSTNFLREETELLVVITVHQVRPLAPHEIPRMPGEDEVNDPDDFELFMMGIDRHGGEDPPAPSRETPPAEQGPKGELGFGR